MRRTRWWRSAVVGALAVVGVLAPGAAQAALTLTSPEADVVLHARDGSGRSVLRVAGTKDVGQTSIQVRLRYVDNLFLVLPTARPDYLVAQYTVDAGATTFEFTFDGTTLSGALACTNDACTTTGTPITPVGDGVYYVEAAYGDGSQGTRAPGRFAWPVVAGTGQVSQAYVAANLPDGVVRVHGGDTTAYSFGAFGRAYVPFGVGMVQTLRPPATSQRAAWDLAFATIDIADAAGRALGQVDGAFQGFAHTATFEDDGSFTVRQGYRLSRRSDDGSAAVDSGVRLSQTVRIRAGAAGTTADQILTWTNTTATPQTITARLAINAWADSDTAWSFPWQGATYGPSANRTTIGDVPAPGYLAVQDVLHPGSESNHGWVAWERRPDLLAFSSASANSDELIATYALTIPANGTLTLRFAAGATGTAAETEAAANARTASYPPPTIAIASPADGASVTSPTLPVAGTSSDNRGVTGVTVNGQAAPLGAAGAWSATLTLQPGTNLITAIASDADGNQATATATVTYAPPATPLCTVPATVGKTLAEATTAITAAGCALGKVTRRIAPKAKKGKVLAQGVPASWQRPVGATVDLVVGKAKPKKPKRR